MWNLDVGRNLERLGGIGPAIPWTKLIANARRNQEAIRDKQDTDDDDTKKEKAKLRRAQAKLRRSRALDRDIAPEEEDPDYVDIANTRAEPYAAREYAIRWLHSPAGAKHAALRRQAIRDDLDNEPHPDPPPKQKRRTRASAARAKLPLPTSRPPAVPFAPPQWPPDRIVSNRQDASLPALPVATICRARVTLRLDRAVSAWHRPTTKSTHGEA